MNQHSESSLQQVMGLLSESELQELQERHRKQILRKFLTQTQLKTDADVQLFVAAFNEPKIGTKVLCGNPEHSSVFRIFSDIILDRTRYTVVWGSRSGSKTYLFGGLDTWYKSASRPQYETKILGGSEGQSILSYDAIKQFRYLSDPDNILVKRLLTTKADFYNRAKVSILRASSRSVRGPHPQCLKLDEVDEIDERVFEDALSQPMSKYGYPPSLIMFSTNHNIGGQMDRAIERATEKGYPVYKYCVWETLESCRDYECSTCKLSAICPGKQMKEADGYYKIEDFIDKLNTLSFAALSRDWLCIKTGVGDTVYEQEWDENIHLCAVDLRMDEPVILSVDFGGIDPFACGVWQKAPEGKEFGSDSWIMVTEIYMTSEKESTTNSNFIAKAKAAPWAPLVREIIPDNSRPDLIQEWRVAFPKAKFTVVDKGTIDEGIEAVKSALRPMLGPPKLYFNRICLHARREVQMYKVKNDKPVDKNNHLWDSIRYFTIAKIKRIERFSIATIDRNLYPE
ncbi:MAG: hypothetical protein PHG61_07250 [Candidatus Marinimicrobia bacterium]|nr:hypothetical protein [Candidatus Neomarinimicrobiota bacterium]